MAPHNAVSEDILTPTVDGAASDSSSPSFLEHTSDHSNQQTQAQKTRRPEYPPFADVLPNLLHFPKFVLWCYVFHRLVMCAFLAPWIYRLIAQNERVQHFLYSDMDDLSSWMNKLVWNPLADRMAIRGVDRTDLALYSLGSNLVHILAYVVLNAFYATCDALGWLAAYRIPPPPHQTTKNPRTPMRTLVIDTLKDITMGFLVSGPLVSVYIFLYLSDYPHVETESDFVVWQAPWYTQLAHFFGMLVFNHVGFYWAHRAFHEIPGAYRRFHKQHHKYQAVISISAEYAHPVEQLVANLAPTIGYNVLASGCLPMTVWYSWLFMRLHDTFESHSGFDFRGTLLHKVGFFCGDTFWHEYHHSRNRGNYGQIFLDWTFGTMDTFVADTNRIKAPAQRHQL